MDIKHFSIARMQDMSLADFLTRVAGEVRQLEAANVYITDISFAFPARTVNDMAVAATIYFRAENTESGYDIKVQEFMSNPQEGAVLPLIQNIAACNEWLAKHTDSEFYEAKTDLFVDARGNDIARTKVYYYPKK